MNALTNLESLLLAQLQAHPSWMTRAELANGIGRQRGTLTDYDVRMLHRLVESGVVEMETRPRGVAGVYFVYRVKEAA